MSGPLVDARFERALRDALARRDPGGGVPASLLTRIDAVTRADPVAGRLRWLGGRTADRLPAVAGLAVAAALVLLVLTLRVSPLSVGPGATPATGSSFDPTLQTSGILLEPTVLPIWLPVMIVTVIPLVLGRRPDRRRIVLAGLVAATSLGLLLVTNHRPPVNGYVYGPISGIADPVPGDTLEPDRMVVTAPPGEPFAVGFGIRNVGLLPMRIEGFVDPLAGITGQTHWTALWAQPADDSGAFDVALARPFEPFELAPGEHRVVYLVGRAGDCALGHPAGLEDGQLGLRLRPVYSVLGVIGVADLRQEPVSYPWFEVMVPTRVGCSPAG